MTTANVPNPNNPVAQILGELGELRAQLLQAFSLGQSVSNRADGGMQRMAMAMDAQVKGLQDCLTRIEKLEKDNLRLADLLIDARAAKDLAELEKVEARPAQVMQFKKRDAIADADDATEPPKEKA